VASGQQQPAPDGSGGQPESPASGSGYRLGAPRAQGPDPYQRFDSVSNTQGSNTQDSQNGGNPAQPPSNQQHFQTPERELGNNLKLSGLLGTRTSETDAKQNTSDAEQQDRPEKIDPDADGPAKNEQD
jgi:hypothetical protein